jgi:hypothetical protein
MIVTGATSDWEYVPCTTDRSLKRQSAFNGGMIDALFNVAVFAALVLCIVGFGAWAHKRVDARWL